MKALLLCTSSMLMLASPAIAQNASSITPASPARAQRTAPPAAATRAAEETSTGIADIVVTASRRSENVQRSALSVQAISPEALVRANVSSPENLSGIAPGVQIARAGNVPQVYIRGVGNFGTNAFAEGAVAFNLDGVYISQGWASRGIFFDLERVEVLKGPQGTLYGRNATGGAVNVITAKPKLGQIGGFVEGQVGNYDLFQMGGAINLPVGDNVAVRAAGQIVDRGGYLTDGYDDDKTQSARLQLLWKPSTDFSLLLSGGYQHAGGKGGGPVLLPQLPGNKFRGASDPAVVAIFRAEPGVGPLLAVPGGDGYTDLSIYYVGAELNWNLGFAQLTVLPAYRDAVQDYKTYIPSFSGTSYYHDRQTSVEARLGNESEKLKWLVGAYYFNERIGNPSNRLADEIFQGVSALTTVTLDTRTRSYALFGQATYSLTDRLRLTGGLRYTYEKKTSASLLNAYAFPNAAPPPPCANGATFNPGTMYPPLFCITPVPVEGRLTYKNVTFKAGVEIDVAPRSMAYANVSTGFKSGGFFLAPPPNTFDAEKLTAYGVGIKNRFFDNKLQVNVEAFYWLYSDHQETGIGPTSIPGYISLITRNSGKAKSYGADLDILFRPSAQDEFSFKVQYNKTKYDTFSFPYPTAIFGPPTIGCAVSPLTNGSQTIDCAGRPLIRSPLWSGTAGYNHTFEVSGHGRVRLGGEVQFASSSYLSTDFLSAGRQEAYAVGNLDLSYTPDSGRWAISLFGRNLWNETVYDQAFRSPFISAANPLANPDGLFVGSIRPPRTYGARLRFNF
jgi:iron complex outermembrane recepter protein